MASRLREFSAWVTSLTILLTLLTGSGLMVYCVGTADHAAIELTLGKQHCDEPLNEQDSVPAENGDQLTSAPDCIDQLLSEEAEPFLTSTERISPSATPLRYELPTQELPALSLALSRSNDIPAHPSLPVVRAVILLI